MTFIQTAMQHSTFFIALFTIAPSSHAASWENALHGMSSEARNIIEKRCRQDAKEVIYKTINEVRTIFIDDQDKYARSQISIPSNGNGLSYSPTFYQYGPDHGLYSIETYAQEGGASKENPDNLPFFVRDFLTQKRSYTRVKSATVEVSYRRMTTENEENLGVFGRSITIIDSKTRNVLGERVEFFWLSGGGFRNGNAFRDQYALCPNLQMYIESSPSSFVGKVVNPDSFPCSNISARQKTIAHNEFSRQSREMKSFDRAKFGTMFDKWKDVEWNIDQEYRECAKQHSAFFR